MRRSSITLLVLASLVSIYSDSATAGDRDSGANSPVLRVAPGGSVTFRVHGREYQSLDALRVYYGRDRNELSRTVSATIGETTRGGRWVTVRASSRASAGSYYRIHGLSHRRELVKFPVRLVVDGRNPTRYADPPRLRSRSQFDELSVQMLPEVRHFITRILEHPEYRRDRTVGYYPADPMLDDDGHLWHPGGLTIDLGLADYFRIDHVSPESPGYAGHDLTIYGESLPFFEVRLGNLTLDPISNDSKQITVRLPESPMIGDLRLYDPAKDALSDPLIEDYEVLATPIFDHFRHNANDHDWLNAYLLAQISFLAYSDSDGEEPFQEYEERMETSFQGWGLEVVRVIDVYQPAEIYKTSGSTQVVIARNDQSIFVTFVGSETWDDGEDLDSDLNVAWKSLDSWGKNLAVHEGVYEALEIAWSQVLDAVQDYRGQRKLWITGHSLGGSLAQLAAFRFHRFHQKSCPVQGVTTYAQLRIGNPQFATTMTAYFGTRSQRWALSGDVVTVFPSWIMGYQHTGILNNIHADGSIALAEWGEMWVPTTLYIPEIHNAYAAAIRDGIDVHAPELLSLPLPAPLPK